MFRQCTNWFYVCLELERDACIMATFHLTNVGLSNRYQLKLHEDDGTVIFIGQPREMKPMCIDELALLRSVCEKDNFYQKIFDERGYH